MKRKLTNLLIEFIKKLLKIFFTTSRIKQIINENLKPYQLVKGPLTYKSDGLATIHNCDFLREELFTKSYNKGKKTGSWGEANIQWRAYVVCWCAFKAKSLEGDFVECGVNKGGYAKTVITYIDFNSLGKRFYLLDTFNGLVEKYITGNEKKLGIKPGGYQECYEFVKKIFKNDIVEIIKGPVPETLPEVKAQQVAYLSLDMNCVEPEIAAANFFWNKIVSGGVIILDDYGWQRHNEQKLKFDLFAHQKSVRVLSLPTGQGIIIKP